MKKIAYAGCLGVIGIISTEFGIVGVLPQVAAYYNISIGTAGILLSAFAMTIFLLGPFVVLSTSGINRKKMMVLVISIFLASNIVSAFAPPFWLLLVARVIPAVLHPVFFSAAMGAVIKSAKPSEQHKLMGIVIGGIAISQVSIIPLSSYMASLYGWQTAFVIQSIISAIAIAGIILFVPNMPVADKKSNSSQLQILKIPRFQLGIALNVFMIAAWFSSYSYFADYLGKAKQMNPQQISYMLLLFALVGVVANWLASRLLSKNVAITTAFFLTGTILLPTILLYSGTNLFVQIAVVAFWGIMYGPCFLTGISYMIEAAPEAPEFASSLQTSFANLGVSIGTTAGGWVIATKGMVNLPWVGAAFGVLAFIVIIWRQVLDKQAKTVGKNPAVNFDKEKGIAA